MREEDSRAEYSEANIDSETVSDFGREWSRFTQTELGGSERRRIFDDYFKVFPWELLPSGGGVGADIGCGSGRWATLIAPRVAHLNLVDASPEALSVARANLSAVENVSFHIASVDSLPFPEASLDFIYSLGVLHHVPDTKAAIYSLAGKLKPGGCVLLYLYYAFDHRPIWFRALWRASDILRRQLVRMPWRLRYWCSQIVAAIVYWPLARGALLLEKWGYHPGNWPLRYYRDKSFYVMRTDAIDRLGTHMEHRFTREQIETMLTESGFRHIVFAEGPPYWCVSAVKDKVSSMR